MKRPLLPLNFLLFAATAMAGCPSTEHAAPVGTPAAPPVVIPAAPPAVTPAATAATAPATTPTAGAPTFQPAAGAAPPAVAAAVEMPKPKLCEVEFKGKIDYSGKLAEGQRWFFSIAQGDCMAPDAHIIGNFWANPGGDFFGEVFSKWGADLTLCVAAVSEPNQASTVYAKAKGVFHAEKTGEVEITGLVLMPKAGPKKLFPAARPPI